MQRLGVELSLVLFALGCSDEVRKVDVPANQISEHRDYLKVDKKRGLGAPCDDTGKDGCQGGACIRVFEDLSNGSVCSRSCTPAAGCPAGYACAQIYPTDDAWFCLPLREGSVDGGLR